MTWISLLAAFYRMKKLEHREIQKVICPGSCSQKVAESESRASRLYGEYERHGSPFL